MANTQEAKVDTPCGAYNAMRCQWSLIDDLLAGSEAMRARAATYLPKFPKEDINHYQIRVTNSSLFGAYSDTFKSICSKPFSRPVTIQGELTEPLDSIADDVDGQGNALGALAKDCFADLVNRGVTHVLIDYPITVSEDGSKPNLQQERTAGYRPRLIHVRPDQLIGWRTQEDASGKPVLTQIRIAETKTEPDGEWGEKQVHYVRVIEPEQWRLYSKQGDDKEYVVVKDGKNSLGKVPLVTAYSNQTGFLTGEPPLKELAERNRKHFQSESDQTNCLHVARTATLFVKGFDEEQTKGIALGPNQLISTLNPNADVKFVEHSGAAIEAGAKDLADLKEEMVMLGLQPFTRVTGTQTATGQSIDESRANSDIQAWVITLEGLLYRAYKLAAEWVKVELPEDFKADVFNDFALWLRATEDIANLIVIRQARELSRLTFLREVKRRGILSETVDVETEIGDIEAEGPALGMVGVGTELED